MTLRDSLVKAIESWQKAPKDRKLALLDQYAGLGPTPEEETLLTGLYQAVSIPNNEWVCLCVIAKGLREREAHDTLEGEAEAQVERGVQFLDLEAEAFVRWPWHSMDSIMGGMAPGTLHFVVCPSKGGKTTLCRSATREWIQQGRKVFYGGFELRAETLRTMFAADDCNIDAGDVLTGAWTAWPDRAEHRARMKEAYHSQLDADSPYQRVRFAEFSHVDRKAIQTMMEQAHEWGADVVIIDHVDAISGGDEKSRGIYEISLATIQLLDRLAKQYNLVVVATSQTNNEGRTRDLWRDHRPVRPETVKMGAHKMEWATTMMGFYRPVKIGLTKEEKQMTESRERSVYDLLQPEVNAFCVMAHRAYGSRIGQVGHVGWSRGRIVEPSAGLLREIEAAKNRIRTARGE